MHLRIKLNLFVCTSCVYVWCVIWRKDTLRPSNLEVQSMCEKRFHMGVTSQGHVISPWSSSCRSVCQTGSLSHSHSSSSITQADTCACRPARCLFKCQHDSGRWSSIWFLVNFEEKNVCKFSWDTGSKEINCFLLCVCVLSYCDFRQQQATQTNYHQRLNVSLSGHSSTH